MQPESVTPPAIKKTIYPLVETIYNLYRELQVMQDAFLENNSSNALPTSDDIALLHTDYKNMLSAIIDMLDGAKYLWEGGESHLSPS